MKIHFLDDEAYRHRQLTETIPWAWVTHAYTAKQAINWLSKEDFDLVMLDHDLSVADQNNPDPREPTGMLVADHMAQEIRWRCPVIVHSYNVPAGQRMTERLKEAGWLVVHDPGAWARLKEKDGQLYLKPTR